MMKTRSKGKGKGMGKGKSKVRVRVKGRGKAKGKARRSKRAPGAPTPSAMQQGRQTGPGSDAGAALRAKSERSDPVLVRGRTLTEIAALVGITPSGMSKLWLGKRVPSLGIALRLADTLEMPLPNVVEVFGKRAVALHEEWAAAREVVAPHEGAEGADGGS